MADAATIERNRAVVTAFFDGTHSGRLEVIDEAVAETIVTHGFPGGNPASREQYKEWFRTFARSFSNMEYKKLATVADEKAVVVHWRVAVDHTGPFAGIPATGKRVSFDGMALYRMQNGRIAETWLQPDLLSLLEQLGAGRALAA